MGHPVHLLGIKNILSSIGHVTAVVKHSAMVLGHLAINVDNYFVQFSMFSMVVLGGNINILDFDKGWSYNETDKMLSLGG